MNRTYALVWNPSLAAWTVTDERARRRGKGAGAVLAAALLLPVMAFAADLPTGGNVVSGSGAINQPNASQMVIDQASNKLAIDWQSFDIGTGNKVTFNQPGRDAIALNRVLGADGSQIMGQLDANGRVFLINPNGVLFGAGAQVNVGGLVASTLNISDSDFAAGNYKFKGDGSNASVINKGHISAADGGSIALLGGTVSNNGVIVANQGTVALAAGNAVTLDFAGDGLLNVQVDEAVVDALVENHQLIKADGGQVLLTANAGDALLKTVVNNTGVIEAQTLGEKDGKIVLLGSFDGGSVQVAGTLDASAPKGGDGGFIETSGAHVKVADSAKVTTKAQSGKTGTWLIDPNDFTIAASGGNMTGAAVSTAVQNNNFEIQTATMGTAGGNGDIHVNDAVTWNSANTLTLNAERNININAAITASGAGGKVALKYGQATADGDGADYSIKAPINLQSGDNFSTQKGTSGPQITYTVVNDAAALQAMKDKRAGNYAVGSNIDLSSISNWVPVGDIGNFTGQFAGLGHTLSNLTIDRTDGDFVGLFGFTGFDSVIRDIGLVGGSVTGRYTVGGLIGFNRGTIINAYATGNVSGNEDVGGLVGQNNGTIGNAYATGNVLGNTYVGGLAGKNLLTISNAYATGSVSGNSSVGGLVGSSESGTISNTYATGSVSGNSSVGGLVGFNYLGTINSSFYATTDAAGSVINNSGATTGAFSGNNLGTGKIWAQLSASATFAAWNQSIWSFPGTGASVSGYGLGGLPYLTGVTRQADIVRSTLFAGGFGTQDSAYTITSWQQLANISQVLSGGYYFSLSNNLDQNSLGYTTLASATANGGAGWNPLGNNSNPFTGTFNGLSHTISDLIINRSGTSYVGLFGYTSSASTISDIGLVGGSVWGSGSNGGGDSDGGDGGTSYSGALVGYNAGTISNAYATGSVSATGGNGGNGSFGGNGGTGYSGGLVGYNAGSGTINNAYATGTISANGGSGGNGGSGSGNSIGGNGGTGYSGGLVGYNSGSINNAYATGTISANGGSGGRASVVSGVAGASVGGGLSGENSGTINNAYATGSVSVTGTGTGTNYAGGLVGYNSNTISNAYATGNVSVTDTGTLYAGGLVGYNSNAISNAYATGNVSVTDAITIYAGGLVGRLVGGSITNSFYAITNASGTTINNGGATRVPFSGNAYGTGKTWADLTLASTFAGWDIATTGGSNAIWRIYDGHSGPLLRSFLQSVTLTADASGGSKTYDSTAVTGTTTYTSSSLGSDLDTGKILGSSLGYASNSKNAGTYSSTDGSLILSGLYSGQQGYDISYADTSLTISKADLAVTGIRASDKTYDATTTANLSYDDASFNGRFGTDALTVASASGAFTDKNAGTGKTVNITDIVLGGADAANYTLTSNTATTTADISKADLAVTDINANNKTYDATTAATLSGSAVVTAISGDTVSLSGMGVGSFADANAGVNKAVTVSGYSLSGTDANNYNLLQPSGVTATINKADLTLSGSKVYDGSTSVAGSTLTASGVAGETFTVTGAGDASNLTSKNVQNGAALASTTGLSLGNSSNGGLASNYNVLSTSGGSYTVTAKGITLTGISALDKTYDATTTAALNTANVGYSGLVSGDTVTLAGNGTGSFANKNAGANKAVTVSGYSLSGTDAGNYVVTQPTGLTASISKADLAVTGISALNKTYDATTAATLSGSAAVTALGSDIVSVSDTGVGTFADKNAGANKAVTASGYTLSGTDADNYNIVQPTGLTANISKAALTITANNASKTYNGLAFSGGNGVSYNGFVNGENAGVLGGALTYGGSAQGAVNAGTYGLSASGLTSDNYTVSYNAGSLNVAKAQATVTANSGQMIYNGQQQSVSGFTASGLVNGETASVLSGVSTSGGNGSNAGSYIHSATGTDGNYDLSFIDGALTIDKAALTITALDANKIAGQSIALTGYSASGLLGDDSISSVSLSSLGQPTTAAAGNYAIVASDAVGEALSNYAISYREGTLQVTDNTANSQPYIGAIVANSQTVAAPESTSPVSEPEAQNLQMLMTNPLAEVINLQVINQGIRLPEGI